MSAHPCQRPLIFLLLLLASTALHAQLVQIDEAEIKVQETFIEAGKWKMLGEYDKALAILEPFLSEHPDNHAAAFELARIYDQQKNAQKALASLRQALKLAPDNIWYLLYQAEVQERSYLFADAITSYSKALALQPDELSLYYKVAANQQRLKLYADANATFQRLEKRFGYSEDLARRRIELAMEQNDLEASINELERLNQEYPARVENLQFLADLYRQTGRQDKMTQIYQLILQIQPNNPVAQVNLSRSQAGGAGDVAILERLTASMGDPKLNMDAKIKELIPFVQKLAQRPDPELARAIQLNLAALDKAHPNEAKIAALSGDILQYAGDKAGAISAYQKALQQTKSVYSVWEQCAFLLAESMQWKELEKLTNEGLDYFPNQVNLHYLYGMAKTGLKSYAQAESILRQCLNMQPAIEQQVNIYSLLGNVYHEQKAYSRSDQAFEEALKLDPGQVNVLNNYARYLVIRNEKTELAKNMASKSLELRPENAQAETTLAIIAMRGNQLSQSRSYLEKALKHGGNTSPVTLEAFGDLHFMLKDTQQAVQYWQEALKSGGDPQVLSRKIQEKKL